MSGIITILFFASGIRHHLPSLCSCPTPAMRYFPSEVNTREFIKPVIFISNNGWMLRNESPHFHSLMIPFLEPEIEAIFFICNCSEPNFIRVHSKSFGNDRNITNDLISVVNKCKNKSISVLLYVRQ